MLTKTEGGGKHENNIGGNGVAQVSSRHQALETIIFQQRSKKRGDVSQGREIFLQS